MPSSHRGASWVPPSARGVPGEEPHRVGILACVPGNALITFGDLSSLLATSDRGNRDQVFGLLRRAYDGHVTRDVTPPGGTNKGRRTGVVRPADRRCRRDQRYRPLHRSRRRARPALVEAGQCPA